MHVNLGENLLNNLLQQVDLSWSVKFQLWVTDREIPEKWWLNISSNFPFFFKIQPSWQKKENGYFNNAWK